MQTVKRSLGAQEAQMLAYLQLRGQRTVRTGEVREALRLTAVQESRLLARMAKAGLIAQARRGLYLVPARLPLGGSWSPSEILAVETVVADRGGRYQICGPNAFHRYGFDDQVPVRVYAYNNRISGERTVGAVAMTLIKVADDRLGDTETARTPDGLDAVFSSRARTLVDAVYDWSRFNGLPRAFGWIRAELAAERVDPKHLVASTSRYGDVGTRRRIGALLERIGVGPALLRRLERTLPRSTGLIPWSPTHSKRGSADRRWGVVINVEA